MRREVDLPIAFRLMQAVVCLTISSLLFTYVPPVVLASRLGLLRRDRATQEAMSSPQVWNDIVASLHEAEQREENPLPPSLYLGSDPETFAPLVYPQAAFREHAQILGAAGSGKTSRSLMSIITQLIRRGDSSVVVIDLKGDDQMLFETSRQEAAKAGMRFRWHTLREGASTYPMNPFTQRAMIERPGPTVANVMTVALNLHFGIGYGTSFFSSQQTQALKVLLNQLFEKHGRPKSFRDLEYLVAETDIGLRVRQLDNMAHVMTVLGFCADLDALNYVPEPTDDPALFRDAIDLTHPFRQPQVLFYSLSASDGFMYSGLVGSFVMNGLVDSSHWMTAGRRTQTFVVVDEFQQLLSPSLPELFRQARSKDVGYIVAHQSVDDLQQRGIDIRHVTGTNTGLRQWHTVSDEIEAERLSKMSGTTIVKRLSQSTQDGGFMPRSSFVQTETEVPMIPVNDILRASSRKGRSVVMLRQDVETTDFEGFAHVIQSPHTISREEATRREATRWPGIIEGTMAAGVRESRTPKPPANWRPDIPKPPKNTQTSVTIDDDEPYDEDKDDLFGATDD